ncbi:MAG: hypothetical protein J6Q34_02690 [Bacteroidales bacterium]|nr:hypothetical protein [Bacteroidales bacterium]
MDIIVHRQSTVTAREILKLWLMEIGKDMPKDENSAVILANLFPGFVDVSYLLKVWREEK